MIAMRALIAEGQPEPALQGCKGGLQGAVADWARTLVVSERDGQSDARGRTGRLRLQWVCLNRSPLQPGAPPLPGRTISKNRLKAEARLHQHQCRFVAPRAQ